MTLQPSRRHVIQGGAAVAVVAGARAASAAPPARTVRTPLPVAKDGAVHAARRLTFGPTPDLVAHIRDIGLAAFVDEQLRPDEIDDRQLELLLRTDVVTSEALGTATQAAVGTRSVSELQRETLLRQALSNRQLLEVVVAFWSAHLSIYAGHALAAPHLWAHDRHVVRAHALGRYDDMLLASAKSAAMLYYLDNWLSDAKNINENYGRELLELHTVGVRGGYTEGDVRQAALALTGWSVDGRGRFAYRPQMHHVGPLRVMGWRHDNADRAGGVAAGESLIRYLAHHPSTAAHLAAKLVRRFVADTPPRGLVDSTAKKYLAHGTRIEPVLRHILQSREFRDAHGSKHLRPAEYVIASLRTLGYAPQPHTLAFSPGGTLVTRLSEMGQAPFGWPSPDGFPDTAQEWQSTAGTLARWNAVQTLVAGRVEGFRPDFGGLVGSPAPTTAGALVDRLALRVCFQPVASAHRAALLRYVGLDADSPVSTQDAKAHARQLVALLLSSPYGQYR